MNIVYLLAIHFIGSHFVIEQTISAMNQPDLFNQMSLPAGEIC